MSYSIGEISDLCIRAARGCGKPWGVAEEVGWAIRWLARAGLPGQERLAMMLSGKDGVCPVTLGATMSDAGDLGLLERAGAIAEPLLLLPFLSRMAGRGRALRVTIDARPLLVWTGGTDLGATVPATGCVGVSGDVRSPPDRPPRTRVPHIEPVAWGLLNDMAARTYAPATEASRARGAGSGQSDND